MNEKTAKQIENLKKQTIGVEIEMNHITRERAAKLAADHFGTGRYEYTASRNGYSTWSAWDAQGREWKFQKDVSIAGCDAEKCELVTPILHYSDIETLQELVRKLRKAGAISQISTERLIQKSFRFFIPIKCRKYVLFAMKRSIWKMNFRFFGEQKSSKETNE